MANLDQAAIGTPVAAAAGGAPTVTITTNVVVAIGATITLYVAWFGLSTLPTITITGTNGLTWSVDKIGMNSFSYGLAILSAPAPAGLASGKDITVNYGTSPTEQYVYGSSFTGIAGPVNIVGSGAFTTSSTSTTWTSTANTPTAACSVHGMGNTDATGTGGFTPNVAPATPTTGWTEAADFGSTFAGVSFTSIYRLDGASGTSYKPGGTAPGAASTATGMHVAYADGAVASAPVPVSGRGRSQVRRRRGKFGVRSFKSVGRIDGALQTSPIFDSDTTATFLDIADLVAQTSGADANAGIVETTNIAQTTADANGAVTENGVVTVPVSSSDANGATTETVSLTAALSSSDAGSEAETASTTVVLSASDSGTDAEVATISQTTSDANGSVTETAAIGVASTDVNGATTEVAAIRLSATDANGAVTETTNIAQTTSDANGSTTETASAAIGINVTDANGATTETAIPNKVVTDTGTDSEVATLAATASSSDTGSDSETATLAAAIPVSDANSTTTESASVSTAGNPASSDANGATTEAASVQASLTTTDVAGATETATVHAFVTSSDANASTTEAATVFAQIATSEGGTLVEAAQVKVVVITQDSNAAVIEAAQIGLRGAPDTGTLAEAATLKASLAALEAGLSSDTAILVAVITTSDVGTELEAATVRTGVIFPEITTGEVEAGSPSGRIWQGTPGLLHMTGTGRVAGTRSGGVRR